MEDGEAGMARHEGGLTCSVKNGQVRYYEFCEEPPEWIVQTLAMGYPSKELVPMGSEAFCLGHFMQKMTAVATERTPTTAGLRVVRLSHWLENEAPNRPRPGQIGRG
jgi:hypothetical protein